MFTAIKSSSFGKIYALLATFYSLKSETIIKMEAVIEANNKFTVEVHKALKNDQKFIGKNLFYSPSSLSIALAMTYLGAKGNTAGQMAKALKWDALP